MSQTQRVGSTATKVTTLDGETSVKYHDTVVVRFRPGQVVLNSGGWRTATTKLRMNQAANEFGLRFQVFQSKGEWFVTHELTIRLQFPQCQCQRKTHHPSTPR